MSNANVGKVFNMTGGNGGGGTLKLETLTITKQPNKTVYKSGESFDPTGMIVTAGYGYGLTSDVTGYSVSPQILTDGVTEVTITYTEGRVTKTAMVSVTVEKVLVSIAVTTNPSKMAYSYLESFDPAGMVVTATYSDESTEEVSGYTYPETAFSTLGQQAVELSYAYEGVTKTTSLNVTVNPIEVAVPVQNGMPVYDGTAKTPSWTGYDSVKMTMSGETNGVNAWTYTAKFVLGYGYVFPGNQDEAEVEWTIDRATIASLPSQSNVLAANGTPQTPTWDGYDVTQLTIGGDRFGTDAGNYTATFTPTANYKWWDGSTEAKEVTWTITSVIVSIPVQSGSLTYTGAPQTPEWDNFDQENSSVSVTPQTNAGTHSATFTLLTGMWSDGTTGKKTVNWTIGRASIPAVPQQSGSLKYDGNPKTPSWDTNYDSNKMTVSVEAQINAGTGYTASFTPDSNHQWWDGSVGAKTATWTIGKGDQVVSVSPQSVTLNTSTRSAKFTVTRKGDGVISATSGNPSVATIGGINQQTGEVTVNSVNDTTGTAVITVKVAAGTNYLAGADKEVQVNAQFVTIYGVEWDWTSGGSTKGTRTDGAAGFSDPNPAVNNGSGSSPFDNLYPWSGMVKETRTGGVMVKEPKYWYKWTKTGKKLKLQIADGPVEGFHVDPVNMDRGDGLGELDFSYIGRYHCASGTYKSETNKAQQTNITRSQARSNIHNLGSNIWQMDFAQMWYVGMLFLVEFADWNGQTAIGYGCSSGNSKQNNGRTDSMQYHTGTTAANRTTYGFTQYRNIEGWWDNVYDWMDGCYYNSNGLNVIKNPAQFSDSANGVLVGKPVAGYPSDFTIPTQDGLEWALFPSAANGSQTTYVPDDWDYSGGHPCLRHGGDCNQFLYRGPFCVYCSSTSNLNSGIGCRLQERPPKAA
ncbi:bacterial Ig-like domain-containing protein [Flavonifractor plautii]|uniref:bacterial Ig-like domain-containing protein n=1 Tax=Flavonifractor plautii TaxID=292800 RepID=UPI00232D221A|nr:bacterial Ig-like domain-containing protein [Flavonifractor plautii]MDB7898966.1 bacterial Ig-like domain-containing protein [Flavonifractor plautii]